MSEQQRSPISYRDAGVDIDRGNRLVDRIKAIARRTHGPEVLGGVGGFGALYRLPLQGYRSPVLVSGADGVGTKLRLAIDCRAHDSIGIDLVAMCVNDVIAHGAKPLFFLDYYATGRLDLDVAQSVIEGIARGCELGGLALVGGESAEMPGLYAEGDYDLAGFCLGVVEEADIIDGSRIQMGDCLLGVASSGLHSNGYSLVRRLLEVEGIPLAPAARAQGGELRTDADPSDPSALAAMLLAPTRIYAASVAALLEQVPIKGIAHITGGGIPENVARILPPGLAAVLERGRWQWPPVFDWLAGLGRVEESELFRAFNCGLGLVLCVAPRHVESALRVLGERGEQAWEIGEVRALGEVGARVQIR